MTAQDHRSYSGSSKKKPSGKSDFDWISEAIEEARLSGDDVPVGAILVCDGEELGRSSNRREADGDPTGHAEILALRMGAARKGSWRLSGCTLYSTLEPCAMCAEAAIQCRVEKLVFGAYDPANGACGSAFNLFSSGRTLPLPEVIGGIREADCLSLVVDFFKTRGNR